METKKHYFPGYNLIKDVHEKISNRTAQLLGPIVFNFDTKQSMAKNKRKPWGLTTYDLLQFPQDSVGNELGQFLKKARLEPLANAESHDVYHLLFDYSTSLKDEVGLQFFLWGNGKISLATIGTSIGAWCVFPTQWRYLKTSYNRGKTCIDISTIDTRKILSNNLFEIKSNLFKTNLYEKK